MSNLKTHHFFLFVLAVLLIVVGLYPITKALIADGLNKVKLPAAANYIGS